MQEFLEDVRCPLCKGKVSITEKSSYYELLGENGSACISITCNKCHIAMYDHTNENRYEQKRGNLIRKWNKLVVKNNLEEKRNEN